MDGREGMCHEHQREKRMCMIQSRGDEGNNKAGSAVSCTWPMGYSACVLCRLL